MNDNPSPNEQSAALSQSASLDLVLNTFDSRLKHLEQPEETSRFAWLQKKASFFALMIGILLSTISLFDIFWTKPRETLFRETEEFNKAVNAVANLRQNMIQLQYQSNNPQMVMAVNSMVTPQVLANIQYATTLLPRIGDQAGIPQLIVLISESLNIYDWKSADIFVERAIKVKYAVPSLQSEARRYKARLMFSTGKIQEGRKAFEDSLNVLRNEAGFGINGVRAYIISDWAISEFAMGDCGVGLERIRQFMQYTLDPQIPPPSRAALISTLKSQIDQLQLRDKRCPVPTELQSLQ